MRRGLLKLGLRRPLLASFSADEYIPGYFPKIFPVCQEWIFFICFKVFHFGMDDFLEGFGHIGIKRGEQSWFVFRSFLLQFGGIKAEIVLTEGTYSYQLHIAAEEINEHG